MICKKNTLSLKYLGIDTYKESVVYMRKDCHICLAEGFDIHARVRVTLGEHSIIATLNMIDSSILKHGEVSLSKYAWKLLSAYEEGEIIITHAKPVKSLSFIRSKIYGNKLSHDNFSTIINDITLGHYSDIHISSFLTACAARRLDPSEITSLTKTMVEAGDQLHWSPDIIVDKHCVGGLPGNRSTPIIVPIVAAFGLTMPKTSSRAITSPAGTADTMEVFAPVELDVTLMKKVVQQEKACIVWGGSVALSPADDILIRVEKALDLDSEGQLVASILSKKIAAGSTHVLIDIPIGPTAKVRSQGAGALLKEYLESVARNLGLTVKVIFSDGSQPVGRGIGPALEARDILSVLKNETKAPQDLREHSLSLAGQIIEFSPDVAEGQGLQIATTILNSGQAWEKFQSICKAQGGLQDIPQSLFTHVHKSKKKGTVQEIDNREISRLAKLAGAPFSKVAGLDLHVSLGSKISQGTALFTIHANSLGELDYAIEYLNHNDAPMVIKE